MKALDEESQSFQIKNEECPARGCKELKLVQEIEKSTTWTRKPGTGLRGGCVY